MTATEPPAARPRRRVPGALRRTFGSLDTYNYRLYFAGDLVSHVGSWMETMAEAWLVVTLGVGPAWVFFVNAVSFVAVGAALLAMRPRDLRRPLRPTERPSVREGVAHAWAVAEIRATIVLVAVVGTLVYNFPTFLTLL